MEGEVGTGNGVAVDGRVEELRCWGKCKTNSRVNDFLGARQSTMLVETLEQKVKYVTSTGREAVSGTLIGSPEEPEKAIPISLKREKRNNK